MCIRDSNGLALGQHGLMGKQNLYEHSIRVPLLFAGPGIPRNRRKNDLVYLLDIFPTLCDLAGIAIPPTVEGCSLVSTMRHGQPTREALYLAYLDKQRGIRTQRWKLIEYVVNGEHTVTQLFDLKSDPWETRNLASEKRYAARLRQLRRQMAKLRRQWDDTCGPWSDNFWNAISWSGDICRR